MQSQLKIGLFGTGLDTYWGQFDGFSIVILIFNVAVDADQHIAIFQNRGIGFLR